MRVFDISDLYNRESAEHFVVVNVTNISEDARYSNYKSEKIFTSEEEALAFIFSEIGPDVRSGKRVEVHP